MSEKLTVKQALEQGFEHWGYTNQEWQHVKDISNIDDSDFSNGEIALFSKDFDMPSISNQDLQNLIADHVADCWGNDTGDDTQEVYNVVKNIDFSEIADKITDSLSHHKAYKLTKIILIP